MSERASVVGWMGLAFGATLLVALAAAPTSTRAQTVAAALTGRVTSMQEGPMEGVLVRASRVGSNKTITVVSDATGTYSFPQDRLDTGGAMTCPFEPSVTYGCPNP
jgi:hypothetical protein